MTINRTQLLSTIRDQSQRKLTTDYINREALSKLTQLEKTSDVVVISGIRRCGKSTLLDYIRSSHTNHNFYLNFDDDRLIKFELEDFQLLTELFIEEYGDQHTYYFDEIQNIKGWERFVRRLHDTGKKVYITGSNASLLSRELGTHLTGRYALLELYPLSYKELVKRHFGTLPKYNAPTTVEKATLLRIFNNYLIYGGFPAYIKEKSPEYLKTLYDSILYRDLVVRYNLRNETTLKELIHYVASNVGKDTSFSQLQRLLGLSNPTTIKEYFDYLHSVYLAFIVKAYSPSLKKQTISPKKAYFIDPGMIQSLGFRPSQDNGRLLENIVYLELLRRGEEIYFHKDKLECDFILRKGTTIVQAIQVTKMLSNPKTKDREIKGLMDALQTYNLSSGTILTEDEEGQETVILSNEKKVTVHIIPIWKWLLAD